MCESKTNALRDPKDVPDSTETTDVPQLERTSLFIPHSEGATPTNAYPETDGIMTINLNQNYDFFPVP